ncbi:MAG: CopD family protein [Gammaproteobacteria bacterium]
MAIALSLHLLAAVVWVGGMFFAYVCLRPVAASQLEPPLRLALWNGVFARFFRWVWIAIVALPITGYWMIFGHFGGMASVGWPVHAMQGIGWVMIALYLALFLGPYQELNRAVNEERWPDGGKALNRIRQIVATNLVLGLVTVVLASGGRWMV